MPAEDLFKRYQDLQAYVGWTADDQRRVREASSLVEGAFPALIDDFYAEIERHPDARRVITGGAAQIERLKGTLLNWLHELFFSDYNADYVERRWRVGYRHVRIGLDQVYTNAALSRLRRGLSESLEEAFLKEGGAVEELLLTKRSLNKLLDLDLAIIELAYQTAFQERQQGIERLAAIGQMAGGVAHELRNPLNVVKTSVYFLQNAKSPRPEKVNEHLQRIERQVGMADGVITALNSFAKMPLPIMQAVPVGAQIREVLELNPLPAEIELAIAIPDGMPAALGDAGQLRIVFGNLIRNAREAMAGKGQLSIAGRQIGQQVEVRVADSGPGIRPDDMRRIMEPLFTTKARGIGLGLAISRAIIEKHNGKLTVENAPGSGAVFTVTLEAAPDGAPASAKTA